MSKSIFLRNRKRPDVANRIMSNMNDHDNPDMDVNFKLLTYYKLHNNKIKLLVSYFFVICRFLKVLLISYEDA